MQNRSIAAAVVVVYNQLCCNSQTCAGLLESGAEIPRILIFDNSKPEYLPENREFCRAHGWEHLGGSGNLGISKAYNACMDALQGEKGVVCLFDDDTQVDGAYFAALRSALARTDAEILVPVIYAGGQLISPCIRLPDCRCRLFGSEEALRQYSGDGLTAINSCMAIDLAVFDGYRYDEHIFLDGVDHTFLEDQKRLGRKIFLLDYRCSHGFSGTEKPPISSALVRFRILCGDFSYILRHDRPGFAKLIGRRALHLTVQYRSIAFLKVFLESLIKEENK